MQDALKREGNGEGGGVFCSINLDHQDSVDRYKLLTGTVIPRPIALVATMGWQNVVNLAPFSQFMIFAVNPGLLGFSVSSRLGGSKDTVRNLRETGEMVINITQGSMADQVVVCSRELTSDVSEADQAGLELLPSEVVVPPRVAASPVHFECDVERMDEIGDAPNTIVVGRIRKMHIRKSLIMPGCKVDGEALSPLGRVGGNKFCHICEFEVK